MSNPKLKRYTCVLLLLLLGFVSVWYAQPAWSGHVSSAADEQINVAAAANGGVALASSTINDNFPASAVIDGDRKGLGWGAGGGWADGTPGEFPDSIEVQFSNVMSIDEVDVFTVQDAWWNPVEPTTSMTFYNNGVTSFDVDYWNGSDWQLVPGGSVVNNMNVWRKITFPAVVAEKIRVTVNAARSPYSTLVELEAYGVPATPPDPSPTPTPLPSDGGLTAALEDRDIYIDADNNVGFGTASPIFNDDGTTGAFIGKWVAVDGKLSGAAAYFGIGGTIATPGARVGSLNFYNRAIGGADNRTAAIFSFNGSKLGTGNLEFFTSPNFIGPVRRMQIAPTGEVGINHAAERGTTLQIMGQTTDATANALGVLNAADQPLLTVRNDGEISVGQPGHGIVLKSPNGQVCRKLTIDDAGNLVVKEMATCPH